MLLEKLIHTTYKNEEKKKMDFLIMIVKFNYEVKE